MRIVDAIQRHGPLPFDRYMHMALYEPGLGYYVNGLHKFGQDGDFVTAPEQGPLFAGALARCLTPIAEVIGSNWTLMEVGPGSGALMRDLLLQLQHPPAKVLLLESSAALREVQAETLSSLPARLQQGVEWIAAPPSERFEGVIVANEVLDALPVKRFEIIEGGLLELAVDWDGARLGWACMSADHRLREAAEYLQNQLSEPLPPGFRSELCVDLAGWLQTITASLDKGVALCIDYGYPRAEFYRPERNDGTLVAHYRHRAHFDPFVWPGLNDLSAFVDFTAVAEAALEAHLDVSGFTSQAGFVLGSGIGELLAQTEDPAEQAKRAGEFKKLVLPGEMGEKFKLMALSRQMTNSFVAFEFSDQRHRL